MTVLSARGKSKQAAMAKRLLQELSTEEVTKAKEAIEVLGGLMKDTAGSSTSSTSSPPGPSTSTEDKDSKSTSGKHIAIATFMTVSVILGVCPF